MHTDDYSFFEDYKSLERLCSDMYSCQNGVTEYINQMEFNDFRGKSKISGWENDYKMLKHVRHIRNQLAHESPTERLSEPGDRAFVNDFRKRLLNTEDPLTLLRKKSDDIKKENSNSRDNSTKNIAAGVCVCIVLILIIIFIGIILTKQ